MIRVSGPKSGPSLAALCSKGSKMPAERQVRASHSQTAAVAVVVAAAADDDNVDLCWFGPEGQGCVFVLVQRSSYRSIHHSERMNFLCNIYRFASGSCS